MEQSVRCTEPRPAQGTQLTLIATETPTTKPDAQETIRQLRTALQTNREISVAVGIFMIRHRLTRQGAFDLLATASQRSNMPLADVARRVVTSEEKGISKRKD